MDNQEKDFLESLIDKNSLGELLQVLANIAYCKAAHIEENWQDENLAKTWDKDGAQIEKIIERIKN